MTRYLVIRVPVTGPPARAGAPNDFATLAEARARVADIVSRARVRHHTYLDIEAYDGDLERAMEAKGILR